MGLDFKFKVANKPSEETIEEFHKIMAKAIADKLGEENTKKILEINEKTKAKEQA